MITPAEQFTNNTIARAVLSGLQGYLSSHGISQPPLRQVYLWTTDTKIVEKALTRSLYYEGGCKDKICPVMGWEGNSDITGRGVRLSNP